jgi:hypothetical protein
VEGSDDLGTELVVDELGSVGNLLLRVAFAEGAVGLALEDGDAPACRRPKAVAFANCVQRRRHVKSGGRPAIGRMMC